MYPRSCTVCTGVFGDAAPDWTPPNAPFPTPGVVGRTPDEALATELYRCLLDLTSTMQRVCPGCGSAVSDTLSVCDDRSAAHDRLRRARGTPFVAWGELRRDTCRDVTRLPVQLCVMGLAPESVPRTRGIDVIAPSIDDRFGFARMQTTPVPTEARFGVLVSIGAEADLTPTLDEHLTAVDVVRSPHRTGRPFCHTSVDRDVNVRSSKRTDLH